MAGTLKSNLQLGDSLTATQNFTLTAAAADGTLKLARGNAGATTQDILTVDAAGIASLLGQRIYSRGNVLGTVSQASGVPTGAIVERGSNANGEYVRFADGAQICTFRLSGFGSLASNSVTVVWTFPSAFALVPQVNYSSNDIVSPGMGFAISAAITASAAQISRVTASPFAQTNYGEACCVAVGRWF